ncbi:hypothetical protein BH10ACT3_BH10ACT3_10220 [soil metagenome]
MRRVLLALLPLTLLLAACQTDVTMGAVCSPGGDPTSTDGTYVMVCRDGRWTPIMTAAEFVKIGRGEDVTIAPLPALPEVESTPPTTGAPAATTTTAVPATTTTTTIPTGSFAALSGGQDHTCALTPQGGVKCWGGGPKGQLGHGVAGYAQTMVDVTGLTSGAAQVSSGRYHTCALTTAGGVKCWGQVLGDSSPYSPATVTSPVDVAGLTSGVVQISSGDNHACAVTDAGAVKCWGKNDSGQLGDGTTTNRLTPVDVVGLGSGIRSVEAGDRHTCVVTTAGGMKCWGRNYGGQLGDGTNTPSTLPVDVVGLSSSVSSIDLANEFTCAVLTTGGVSCWGYNFFGPVGDGSTTDRWVPTQVAGLTSGVAAVSTGYMTACVLMTGGGVKCWGYNGSGGLGDGTTTNRSTPVDVVGISNAISVGSGQYHACAVLVGGDAECWGYNNTWQLGDQTRTNSSVPIAVLGPV